MKKALSVLLIIAAIFGFYGGAVNLKDVLDCKAYWEEEGRKTDENLNKLEDGINQLAENEAAYLDGKDQVAQGEIDLANGEKQLAEGLKDFEQGKMTIADVENTYGGEGAPVLKKAYDGVNELLKAKGSLNKASAIVAKGSNGQLTPEQVKTVYNQIATAMKNGIPESTAASAVAAQIAGEDTSTVKSAYDGVVSGMKKGASEDTAAADTAFNLARPKIEAAYKNVKKLVDCNGNVENSANVVAENSKGKVEASDAAKAYTNVVGLMSDPLNLEKDIAINYVTAGKIEEETTIKFDPAIIAGIVDAVNAKIEGGLTLEAAYEEVAKNYPPTVPIKVIYEARAGIESIYTNMSALMSMTETAAIAKVAQNGGSDEKTVSGAYYGVKNNIPENMEGVPAVVESVIDSVAKNVASGEIDNVKKAYEGVKSIMTAFETTSALKSGLSKDKAFAMAAGSTGMTKSLIKQAYEGYQSYVAGKKKLASAPAQLAAGRAQLADGRAQLADGKAQLAEYEDGEQQVRDGLATLFNTEPNGGLKSIADRIGGDGNFDDLNGHLKLDEGLDGVTEGRNYSADSGVLITKEVLTRGIGTACGLAAALFALIAALLCFAKKHKGAGVFAVLTGLCGIAGIVVAKSAGTEFSGLAGSPLSPVPYIAFAILAVVALAAAIVNFGAKKEA